MATACQTVPGVDAFASNILAFLDCEASTLGAGGYQTLSMGGSTGAVLVGVMLTIFIALWGYRLILGDVPTTQDVILAAIKVGVVLTLATSWPAYHTLIYDVVLRAPAQLASDIGTSQDLPGSAGGLAVRLDSVEAAYRQLEILGPGQPRSREQQLRARQTVPPPLFANYDTFALGSARLVFLGSSLGSFAMARLAAGILLALGPIFAGFLLFDATRPLFVGWLKSLCGIVLAAVAISVVLGVELTLLEPWLQQLVAIRLSDIPILGAPGQLLAMSLVFAATLAGVMLVLVKVASGNNLPVTNTRSGSGEFVARQMAAWPASIARGRDQAVEDRSRALVIADAIAATQRRETGAAELARATSYASSLSRSAATKSDETRPVALGQSYRRRTGSRISARAIERDRRA